MIWNPFQLLSATSLFLSASPMSPSLSLRLITHNIRYANTSPGKGERVWAERYPLVLSQLQHETRYLVPPPNSTSSTATTAPTAPPAGDPPHTAALIFLQEVLHTQLVSLLSGLNNLPPPKSPSGAPPSGPEWAHVGVGRDDGKQSGEYSPILYPTRLFALLDSSTTWLSPTPNKPSKGWDAGSVRILTLAVLQHRGTGRRLIAGGTHLDNAGSVSRAESVKIISRVLREAAGRYPDAPVVLAGDFNSFPTGEAYRAMAADGFLADVHEAVAAGQRYGERDTFTGFQPEKERDSRGRIDFLWVGPQGNGSAATPWAVDGYGVLPNKFEDGIYASDHRAVVGDVRLVG
jgi:endonuclease/exonuclease/phosphatase family metal-dependent hydrolase